MNINNFRNLSKTPLRKKALEIAEAGYSAINIENIVNKRILLDEEKLKISHTFSDEDKIELNLSEFKRIFIVGIGKRSALASISLARILGKKLSGGIVLDVKKPSFFQRLRFYNIRFFKGSHPLPSKANIKATKKIIKFAKNLEEKDLLITFICGGGSALACASETELLELTCATKELTKAGADIAELNTVRKHLSEFKGGNLAKIACPAQIVSLIISDVCGNELSIVASGPTVLDKTTKKEAEDILKKYNINPESFNLRETPKDINCFKNIKNILFVCNQDAATAMVKKSQEIGFETKIYSLALEGEAKNIFSSMVEGIKTGQVIIAAGETTVTINSQSAGKGGRNMEAILGLITNYHQLIGELITNEIVAISLASDAWDNSDAAGAIGDYLTLEKAEKLNLNLREFLENHNSYNFFKKTGDLIFAERKCFNVADLMLILKK